jgi:hypothetical protein
MLSIDKELFQWEKGRYVTVTQSEPKITTIEFYNKKSKIGIEQYVFDDKAMIPNLLLKDSLPIIALGC